ncbi:hypothetical protein AK812_SmicGene31455 [Symbiodinium microadriaticum]|uniref:Uncharacterized protein n=1 Tax=Symbiodinium microadriaticum TaxID=2951 RepID=A0A1Q9CWM7_SYMMI|nr:hypothetical protein AK812_SmicGene31455 [Symbiodinium microadriaticum]CAE7654864.1 unnamed protein product [Symbiodinium microadriaticum]
MNKCIPEACKTIFARLADFLFAYSGSPVAQLAEEGDETLWYKEFSRPIPCASNGRHKVVRTSLLRKVDMLSIGVEDTLPHYTVEEIAAGFKKTLAFQTCASKQDGGSSGKGIVLDHQSESWQPLHFTPRVGVRWREGHVVRRGHVEQWRGGHACDYTVKEIVAGFMRTLAFHTCAIKQNKGSSSEGICLLKRKAGNYCTSLVVRGFMGEDDTLNKVAMLSVGLEDTLTYTAKEFVAGLTKALAFQMD